MQENQRVEAIFSNPQWVYTVVLDASEIWGDGADPSLTVSIDAWESYLERA